MTTHLTKVGSTYYFRRVVPVELRPYFLTATGKPRVEFMISLGTKERREAEERARLKGVETDAQFREAEAKLASGVLPATSPAPKYDGPWDPFPTEEHLEALVAEERFEVEFENDPLRQRVSDAVRAARASWEDEQREARLARQEARAAKRVSLMDLFDAYVAERQPEPATVKRWRPVMKHIIAHLGHDDASRITQKDVVAWKEALLSQQIDGEPARKARTVKETYMASLSVVLAYAKSNGKIASNPSADVTVRVPIKVRLRDPGFTEVEALTILKAACAPQPASLTPEHKLARRWVPWLCAYTGARVNEMSQLRAQDVQEVDGVWTVRITPEAGSVKGRKARIVPLHAHLIEQGFLKIVDAKGEGPLFYNPDRGRGGSDGNPHYKKVGERLAAWVRQIGVNDPEVQPNHAWRHLFKTNARSVRMDPEARDVIQGHAHKGEGQKYGVYPLPALSEELAKLPRFNA